VIACIDADVDICTPKGFELRGIVMSATLIEELGATLNIELPRAVWHRLCVMETDETTIARLRHLLATIHDGLANHSFAKAPTAFDNPAAREALEDALLVETFARASPRSIRCRRGERRKACSWLVEQACELRLTRHDRPLSVLDICRAVGASPPQARLLFPGSVRDKPDALLARHADQSRSERTKTLRRPVAWGSTTLPSSTASGTSASSRSTTSGISPNFHRRRCSAQGPAV
jgi:AraC family ethanolamine operon transcriptional activator